MNTWNFTGHLGKDCQTGATQGGTATCEFSVAVYSGYGDNEKTTWASCVIFGKRAEGKLPALLMIGQKVAISGELTQETWEKQNGGTGFKLKVVVNTLDLIGAREEKTQEAAPRQQAPQQQEPQQQNMDDLDQSIPF